MNEQKCYAAVLLGQMGKGKPKRISEEERERRRKAAAYARECKAKKKLAPETT